jgi:cytochrome bd ubiquinol oxidase subunit II
MQTLWFILVGFMLTAYVVLDGFDLGAGVIHLFAGHTDKERRLILRAIGPVWDGNEVWLIASGGTLFFSFPQLYASSFSGFYLPLIIVLWLLMLRGVSVELRSQFANPVWSSFWDGFFFLGSTFLTIFYGAAMANVIRGVPLDSNGYFFEPLWTDFNPFSAHPGILDWYTILIGLLALCALTAHGSAYIAVKVPDPLSTRARRIARIFLLVTFVLAIPGTIGTWAVQPQIAANFLSYPWGFLFPLIALGAMLAMGYFNLKRRDLYSFFCSCALLISLMASAAFGIYPLVLPAIDTTHSLTIQNASASAYGQTVGLIWWIFGMLLASVYFIVTYRLFWGKVSLSTSEGY